LLPIKCTVRPQDGADEADAGDHRHVAIEQTHVRAGGRVHADAQPVLDLAPVKFVISRDIDDGLAGESRHRHGEIDALGGGAGDVAGQHANVEIRQLLGQRPVLQELGVQVGKDENSGHDFLPDEFGGDREFLSVGGTPLACHSSSPSPAPLGPPSGSN
jgi:hypothetical protein